MANVIKHKRGSGSDPAANNLVLGELAIRTDNGKLFTKMDSGAIAEIAGGGSDIAINTLSSSSATGGGSATFNGSAYRFTLSSPPSVSAAQLLVSINGVIQKPVAGTGQPSEGFSVDGNDIILGDAPATGADFFILTFRSLGVSEPADNSVTSAKIVDGTIINADINASAAIDVSKLSGVMPLTGGTFSGNVSFGDNNITNVGIIALDTIKGDADDNTNINFAGSDTINIKPAGTTRLAINTSGINVTGAITSTGAITGQDFRTASSQTFFLTSGDDWNFRTITGNTRLTITNTGQVDFAGNVDCNAGLDVTGAITGTGDLTIDTNTLHVDSSNNRVGIGTTSPATLTHIYDSTDTSAVTEQFRISGGDRSADTFETGFRFFTQAPSANGNRHVRFISNANTGLTIQPYETSSGNAAVDRNIFICPDGGDVGIGTTSPVVKLHVSDSYTAPTGGLDPNNALVLSNTNAGNSVGLSMLSATNSVSFINFGDTDDADIGGMAYFNTDNSMTFKTNAVERMRINSSGNVGIGTSSPTQKLHVVGTAVQFQNTQSTYIQINTTDTHFYTAGSHPLRFGTNSTERMRIDTSGNVGIGTTSPISNSGYGGFSLNGSSGSIASLMHNGTEKLRLFGHTNPSIQYAGNLTFFSGVSGGTQRMLIKSDGRVAINTDIGSNEADEYGGFVSMKPTHVFTDSATNLGESASKAALRIRTTSNSSMSLYIGGLDDSIDSARPYLQVGNLSGASGATAAYDLYLCYFGGDLRTRRILPQIDNTYDLGNANKKWDDVFATNGTINTSDRNEKNTIVDSDLGLSFINKLKPVSYKFNDRTRTHYGLIAQDIETVLTDISKSTTDFAGFIKSELSDTLYTEDEPLPTGKKVGDVKTPGSTHYGLRYGEFIAPLIKAVQELSAKVEALEAK